MAWYAICLAVGREETLSDLYEPAYVPLKPVQLFNRRQRVWRRGNVVRFPGYGFVPDEPITIRHSAVFGYISTSDGFAIPVRDSVVERIRRIEIMEMTAKEILPERDHDYVVGDSVIISEPGPLKGFQGVIEVLKGRNGLEIVLSPFGRSMKVDTDSTRVSLAA